jgi:hypothetical protein
VLAVAPTSVELSFAAPPLVDSSHVSVQDQQGSSVDSGPLAGAGENRLRRPVAIRAAGGFTVAYHVVFADGTTTVGVVRFSVGAGTRPPQAPPGGEGGHEHGIDPLSALLLLADAAVVVAVGALLLRGPRRPAADPSPTDPPGPVAS